MITAAEKLSYPTHPCYKDACFVKMESEEMSPDSGTIMKFALKYLVNRHTIPPKGTKVRLEADEKARRELAQNHGIVHVHSFVGDFQLTPSSQGGVTVSGRIVADIVQRCVISGEEIPGHIDTDVEVVFMPQEPPPTADKHPEEVEILLDVEQDDKIEMIRGNMIDIGAVAEEFFELAVDPYPRKEGAAFSPTSKMQEQDAPVSPFAVLAKLK